MKRLRCFEHISETQWRDWQWQQQNRLHNQSDIRQFFPALPEPEVEAFHQYIQKYHLGLTPYVLSLIELDEQNNPLPDDPIWNQFRYLPVALTEGTHDYDGKSVNWENPGEFPTRLLQHKYPDRAILRITDRCFGHCNYCYLTARVLDREKEEEREEHTVVWAKTLDYLRQNPQIRDLLISGGDPLLLDNKRLERIFSDLSLIPSLRSIRLNTRVLTFNPFRVDRGLAEVFKKYRLTVLEVHMAHPRELNAEMDAALEHFEQVGYRPLILWRAPLLKGINASRAVLEELFLGLYTRRIMPYYIFHYAPYTLGRSRYGLSIREGCTLLNDLRRDIPGPAFPRYTLFHIAGKQDIPLELEGTSTFQYTQDEAGNPVVRFKNWKGKWVTYPDVPTKNEINPSGCGEV